MDKAQYSTHGVFVVVSHQGILIQGKPGVGKSDLALSLIDRGHGLVIDDLVLFRMNEHKKLIGYGKVEAHGKIHIRNLGVLDLKEKYKLYTEYQLDKIVWLSDEHTIDSALPSLESASILGKNIPVFRLTIGQNRPLAILIEAICDINCNSRGSDE